MAPNIQETCLQLLKKKDAELSQMNCEEMEAQVNDMVQRVEKLLTPIRLNSTEASLEPPSCNIWPIYIPCHTNKCPRKTFVMIRGPLVVDCKAFFTIH